MDVVVSQPHKAVLLEAEPPGRTLIVAGTAADRLGIAPTSAASILMGAPTLATRHRQQHRRNFASVGLTHPARTRCAS